MTTTYPSAASTVRAPLGFAREERITADETRPGLLRSATIEPAPLDGATLDLRATDIRDLAAGGERPTLGVQGFERIDLAPTPGLRPLLGRIRDQQSISDEDIRRLRRQLATGTIALADGSRLKILFVVGEGVIMRRAGPAGIDLDGGPGGTHDGAINVHVDQDVLGTPVRQMLRGAAPRLFHHDAPDSTNRRSPLWLVNLWLPLQQITRPLTLVDTRTVNRRTQQLRYALPLDGILERDDEARRTNDIWALRPDPTQQWYFTSELGVGDAYVFDTLSTPHTAFHLPGEDAAADRYRRLLDVERALLTGEPATVDAATDTLLPVAPTTTPLATAIATMDDLLIEANHRRDVLVAEGDARGRWTARSAVARNAVVRSSIEVRAIAIRRPRHRRTRANA